MAIVSVDGNIKILASLIAEPITVSIEKSIDDTIYASLPNETVTQLSLGMQVINASIEAD